MIHFPQHLKSWRIDRCMTQAQLAQKSGMPRPNLVAIERGRRECTLRTLARLAQALELTPGKLLDERPPASSPSALDRRQIEKIAKSLMNKDEPLSGELGEIRDAVGSQAVPLLRAVGLSSNHLQGKNRRKTLSKEIESQILKKLIRLLPLSDQEVGK